MSESIYYVTLPCSIFSVNRYNLQMALFSVYDMNESCQKVIFITITNLSHFKLANVPVRG